MPFMKTSHQYTAIIYREEDGFVSLCPEFDVASQGECVEEARSNLTEALELFLQSASKEEIQERYKPETYISRMEVSIG